MKVEDINVQNILVEEKSYEISLVCNILYKEFMDTKLLRIRVNKSDEIIEIYDGIRCLELDN